MYFGKGITADAGLSVVGELAIGVLEELLDLVEAVLDAPETGDIVACLPVDVRIGREGQPVRVCVLVAEPGLHAGVVGAHEGKDLVT